MGSPSRSCPPATHRVCVQIHLTGWCSPLPFVLRTQRAFFQLPPGSSEPLLPSSPFPSPGGMAVQSSSFCSSRPLVAKTRLGPRGYKRVGRGKSIKSVCMRGDGGGLNSGTQPKVAVEDRSQCICRCLRDKCR